jgi:hypothetical protein
MSGIEIQEILAGGLFQVHDMEIVIIGSSERPQ